MGRASFVWKLVKRIDSRTVKCTLCLNEVAYCGNTTNIHRHLREKHPQAYKKMAEECNWNSQFRPNDEDSNIIDDPEATTSTSLPSDSVPMVSIYCKFAMTYGKILQNEYLLLTSYLQ